MKPTYTTHQALTNPSEKDLGKKELTLKISEKYKEEINKLRNRMNFLLGEHNNLLLCPFDKLEFKKLDSVRREWRADLISSRESVWVY